MYVIVAALLLVAAFFGVLFAPNPFVGLMFAAIYLLWAFIGDGIGRKGEK